MKHFREYAIFFSILAESLFLKKYLSIRVNLFAAGKQIHIGKEKKSCTDCKNMRKAPPGAWQE